MKARASVFVTVAVVLANPFGTAAGDHPGHWSPDTSCVPGWLQSVWANAPNDVFAVEAAVWGGQGGTIAHFDGSEWTCDSNYVSIDYRGYWGVWGTGPENVFAVGSGGVIRRYNGTTWELMDSNTGLPLWGVWGSGPNDIYVVGGYDWDGGVILHSDDGVVWSVYETPSGMAPYMLQDVWGSGPNDVYAVSGPGVILHYNRGGPYDPNGWYRVPDVPTTADLLGVWGSGPNDVFAVGVGCTILHYDGSSWSEMGNPWSDTLIDVWGSGPNDVFAVGWNGTILHYDGPGSNWPRMDSGTTEELSDVTGTGTGYVTVVGHTGIILSLFYDLTLTIVNPEWGEVVKDPDLPHYRGETLVTLTGVAEECRSFSHWNVYDPNYPGDANHADPCDSNPITIVMCMDREVTAVFTWPNYVLELRYNPNKGSVHAAPFEPDYEYPACANVILTAEPRGSFVFKKWMVYDPNYPGDANYADPCYSNPIPIVMFADRQVEARFKCGTGGLAPLLLVMLGALGLFVLVKRRA